MCLIDLGDEQKVNAEESIAQRGYLHTPTIDHLSIHRLNGS